MLSSLPNPNHGYSNKGRADCNVTNETRVGDVVRFNQQASFSFKNVLIHLYPHDGLTIKIIKQIY